MTLLEAMSTRKMTLLATMTTEELWSKLWDLLIQRMAIDATKRRMVKDNRTNQQDRC